MLAHKRMVGEKRTFAQYVTESCTSEVQDDKDFTMGLVQDIILRIQAVQDPADFHLLAGLRLELENILRRR